MMPPNYTQIPNEMIDKWLPHLKGLEVKVLLVIMRKVFGWHKVRDRISLSQLEKLTGSSRTHICKSIESLIQKGLVYKEICGNSGREETYYQLVIIEPPEIKKQITSDISTLGGGDISTPTKETLTKEIIKTTTGQKKTPAVVSPKIKKEPIKIHKCLEKIDIPEPEKQWISKNYSEADTAHAIAFAVHPLTLIETTLLKTIKWACKAKPELPSDPKDKEEENKAFAIKVKNNLVLQPNNAEMEILTKGVEFYYQGIGGGSVCLYSDKKFKERLKKEMVRYGFR